MTAKVDFSDVEWRSVTWTMLVTLFLRAYESRSPRTILNDRAAAELVDRIDYDWPRIERTTAPRSNQYTVTLRARALDDWTGEFLTAHPDATVLHLGCGLDSRAFRLNLPADVRWFDVDMPEVIAMRRRVIKERTGYRMIASSVTGAAWFDDIPTDRPTLVVAEGLVMYLTEDEIRELLQRITDRFPSGQIVFDAMPPSIVRVQKLFKSSIRSAAQVQGWNRRLRCVEETTPWRLYPLVPSRFLRGIYWAMASLPWLRSFERLYRFSF
ncbi:class I SAM-dependent methyltransferase [Mycobacteroides abscessus]|uniref:class I SAM-dependent methyltransferase n=1 Tax=Mycobacteroides abscessus TaxID=36809 RepID=UPI0002FA2BB1|nr:class I SAM-dependent methyltransferase [Mycobacteroides abscessus]AMU33014.1 methyltransferase [Mycobacteroides abscessus]ANO01183.1 methyltransferase [Mycobacteroides abscessus]MBN7319960.1 class I SAM-dependent methyltransferase [Mycobacteroides abscessus subsp. massiliense]MDO3029509.1 class I SAM-dependent methyltransferase [Mycobacteroides abscessus subsp. massiliense]PVA54072.1 class I SAM-dependent methyltransferase [Mycobacteroides abscessus]